MAAQVITKVLRASTGPLVKAGDQVSVWYQGTLVNGGYQFDANYDFATLAPAPGREWFEFGLGLGQVIKGWDQALVGRRLGEVLELIIPSELAYGAQGVPAAHIPANAPLRFKVELVRALPAGSTQADANYVYPTALDIGVDRVSLAKLNQINPKFEGVRVGTDQSDLIGGSEKADLLIGLGGNDQFRGSLGADILIGGAGVNTYVYAALSDSSVASTVVDQILDFKAVDKVNLVGLRLKAGRANPFIGSRAYSGRAGEVRFGAGRLQLDADGDRRADFEILLNGVTQIVARNLVL